MVYGCSYFGFKIENSMQSIQTIQLKRTKLQAQPADNRGVGMLGRRIQNKVVMCCVVYRSIPLLRLECSAQF